jgi:flavin reductase (DIM6/NTAB) family NADH-FMN oxidoreductase RutF
MPSTEPDSWLGDGAPHDTGALRRSLGSFSTGITVITTVTPDGRKVGLTANSFLSVSLDPPLVLWSLKDSSPNRTVFEQCSHFAINVLAFDQEGICRRFATPGIADKFAGVALKDGTGGVPLLDGAVAQFECSAHARHPGGDHQLFIGKVESHRWSERLPLLFCQGVLMPAPFRPILQAQA